VAFSQFCSAGISRLVLAVCVIVCTFGFGVSASAQHLHFTTFNVNGAGKGAGQGTAPQSINFEGEIAGLYLDKNSVYHGFVRTPDGHITTFDAPGVGPVGTLAFGNNPAGAFSPSIRLSVAGVWICWQCGHVHVGTGGSSLLRERGIDLRISGAMMSHNLWVVGYFEFLSEWNILKPSHAAKSPSTSIITAPKGAFLV
jgi:hypothetical protein